MKKLQKLIEREREVAAARRAIPPVPLATAIAAGNPVARLNATVDRERHTNPLAPDHEAIAFIGPLPEVYGPFPSLHCVVQGRTEEPATTTKIATPIPSFMGIPLLKSVSSTNPSGERLYSKEVLTERAWASAIATLYPAVHIEGTIADTLPPAIPVGEQDVNVGELDRPLPQAEIVLDTKRHRADRCPHNILESKAYDKVMRKVTSAVPNISKGEIRKHRRRILNEEFTRDTLTKKGLKTFLTSFIIRLSAFGCPYKPHTVLHVVRSQTGEALSWQNDKGKFCLRGNPASFSFSAQLTRLGYKVSRGESTLERPIVDATGKEMTKTELRAATAPRVFIGPRPPMPKVRKHNEI